MRNWVLQTPPKLFYGSFFFFNYAEEEEGEGLQGSWPQQPFWHGYGTTGTDSRAGYNAWQAFHIPEGGKGATRGNARSPSLPPFLITLSLLALAFSLTLPLSLTHTQVHRQLKEKLGQQKFEQDEIFAYLNKELVGKSRTVAVLEARVQELELQVQYHQSDFDMRLMEEKGMAREMTQKLAREVGKYEKELVDLNEFISKKNKLESELEETKTEVLRERKKHEQIIAELERKTVQEKERLRKEMEAKICDAKDAFMKLTDNHLEATTKKTVQENEQMGSGTQSTVTCFTGKKVQILTLQAQSSHSKTARQSGCSRKTASSPRKTATPSANSSSTNRLRPRWRAGTTHTHTHMYIYIYMHICLFVCMYVCMYACMYIRMYVYIYIYTHTHIEALHI